MLDPKLIKEKPEIIRNMLKSRAVEFDLEGLIESDQKRREFIIKTDELRKKKNQVAITISEKKKAGDDASSPAFFFSEIAIATWFFFFLNSSVLIMNSRLFWSDSINPSRSNFTDLDLSIFLIISDFSLISLGSNIIQSPLMQLGYVLTLHLQFLLTVSCFLYFQN